MESILDSFGEQSVWTSTIIKKGSGEGGGDGLGWGSGWGKIETTVLE